MSVPAGVFSGGLSPASRQRLFAELDELLAQRPALARRARFTDGSGDAADHAATFDVLLELQRIDQRIARLRELLSGDPAEHAAPASADGVGPGRVVTLSFGGDDAPERYLVGSIEELDGDVEVITLTSPLGSALLGRRAGDVVEYRTPTGKQTSVTVLAIE